MRIPPPLPNTAAVLNALSAEQLAFIMQHVGPLDTKGRYSHWRKVRYLPLPSELADKKLTHEQWWAGIKLARQYSSQSIGLTDEKGRPFHYCVTDKMQQQLHWLDRNARGSVRVNGSLKVSEWRNTYLIRSVAEEAISSSQLEGAATTRTIAKEMIQRQREPRNHDEQMIFNNYQAMRAIVNSRHYAQDEKLTLPQMLEWHRILTEKTWGREEDGSGRLRTDDDIVVMDRTGKNVLHRPPKASELPERMRHLCDFANMDHSTDENFLHPVLKAILLHFMLAYDHPFRDGNGRTARALFYSFLIHQGYWLMEYISISDILKNHPGDYLRAFLDTESDNNDLTYFFIHQLDVIRQAVKELDKFIDRKVQEQGALQSLLEQNVPLSAPLNYRQRALLGHACRHPNFCYEIQTHQNVHGVSYDIARKDLLKMADLKLLAKKKQGKQYLFLLPPRLAERMAGAY